MIFFFINGSSISVFFLIEYFWRAGARKLDTLIRAARMVPIEDPFGIP